MPLTLVTGPANAEKAGHVLAAYRAALDRAPLLVVPTAADVERYRRELAAAGAVFGVEVLRFGWLEREVARRAAIGGRPLGAAGPRARRGARGRRDPARPARPLGRDARLPARLPRARRRARGAADHAGALVRRAARVGGRRAGPGAPTPRSSARCTAPTATASSVSGAATPGCTRWRRSTACASSPRAGAARPCSSTASTTSRRSSATPSRRSPSTAGADVTLSLTYEPGRAAFAGRGATFQELLALGADHVALDASADHYASLGLHDLERGLFETGAEPGDPGGGVLLLEGGGERAELELVAADAAQLIREEGFAPEEIAVVLRTPDDHAPLLADVFARGRRADRAVADGRRRAHRARPRRDRAAALRAARRHARRPARVAAHAGQAHAARRSPTASRREARQNGARTAAEARALWEAAHPDFALSELDRVADAHARGFEALCERVATEASALFAAPHRGRAPVLTGPEALDARVAGALRGALGELGALAARAPSLAPSPAELARTLEGLEVFAAGDVRAGSPGAVEVTSPLRIRARRVRALFLCGLQEGVFPKAGRPEPFLGDAERRALNAASGLRLALREDQLDRERFLFYTAVSRPTDVLALSWHAADDEGEPRVRSLFVDDVLDLLDPVPDIERRALGAAGFDGPLAPNEREILRERLAAQSFARRRPPAPIAPLRDPAVLARAARARDLVGLGPRGVGRAAP